MSTQRANSAIAIKAEQIRVLRLRAGLSRAALAQAAGISIASVQRAEVQGRIGIDAAAALVHALAVALRSKGLAP